MPYIPRDKIIDNDPDNREKLDALINPLVDEIIKIHDYYDYDMAFSGIMNYTITRMLTLFLVKKFDRPRYWHIVALSGICDNVNQEFYRRVAVPYEEIQTNKNGDVPEYLELLKRIK